MGTNEKFVGTGYYYLPDEMVAEFSTGVDEMFYVRDVTRRKFFFNEDIEQLGVTDLIRHILQINREDKGIPVEQRPPIYIYLSSNGGDVDAGFELIDVIQNSITPVYVINLSWCYSMAFFVYLAGHKKFATKNAKFLLHDGSIMTYNSTSKARDLMEFNSKMEKRLKEYVVDKTNITNEMYESKLRDEWYMYADEAKELGIVDCIIGEDVNIEEVV